MASVHQGGGPGASDAGSVRPVSRPACAPRGDGLPFAILGLYLLVTAPCNFFLPVYLSETLGFSGAQVGLIFSLQAATGVLAALPIGLANDRVTSRALVRLGLIGLGLGYAALGLVRAFAPFAVLFFFTWSAVSLFRLSLDAQVLKTDRGQATGSRIGRYHAFRFGALALGTPLAGYLLAYLEYPASLALVGLASLALAALAGALPPVPVQPVAWGAYRAALRSPRALVFVAWSFGFALHWGAEFSSYGLFLRQGLGLDWIGMGWYMTSEFVALVLVVLLGGRLANRDQALGPLVIAGLLISGLGHLGMVYPAVAPSAAFRFVHGLGDGLIFVVSYVGLVKLFRVEQLGGLAGLVNGVQMLATIAGALVFGPLGQQLGYDLPLALSGVLSIMLVLPLLAVRRQLRPPGAAPTSLGL